MSCSQRNIKLRQTPQYSSPSPQYVMLYGAVIIPVFCVCMISAMGSFFGIRHAVSMQFDVDADTEHIKGVNAEYFYKQQIDFEKILFN